MYGIGWQSGSWRDRVQWVTGVGGAAWSRSLTRLSAGGDSMWLFNLVLKAELKSSASLYPLGHLSSPELALNPFNTPRIIASTHQAYKEQPLHVKTVFLLWLLSTLTHTFLSFVPNFNRFPIGVDGRTHGPRALADFSPIHSISNPLILLLLLFCLFLDSVFLIKPPNQSEL